MNEFNDFNQNLESHVDLPFTSIQSTTESKNQCINYFEVVQNVEIDFNDATNDLECFDNSTALKNIMIKVPGLDHTPSENPEEQDRLDINQIERIMLIPDNKDNLAPPITTSNTQKELE